ncbi:hypothetical protein SLEP1_g34454 [Rubroshorea leprosula]|uniref:Retrotransposon gag domain-containing protein n=1 Tax=Rubroshorea leprosula TaxID=152421 RepID=A0AAV5KJY2_9ROSI|nr:hypothetical protein SLEP1_g34454 [Rubroshorea leprosula]
MDTFLQEFMAEMRHQASPATSVPPPSPVIPTWAALPLISPVPISAAPTVPSWKIYTEFQKLVTRRFDGTVGFEQVGSWFTEVERGFRLLKVSNDLKVDVGSYMLTGDALTWWETYLKLHQDALTWWETYLKLHQGEPELSTWDGFKRVFMQEYIPDSKRRELQREFADLKQGSRTVEQYKKEFDRYLPFVGGQVRDEQSKANRFLWGLNLDIYLAMNQFKPATYRETTNKAIDQEKAMARVQTQDPQKVGSSFKKRKFDESHRPSISTPPRSDTDEASKELRVAKTVGQASAAQRTQPAPPICHACGKVGHTCDQCHVFTRACFRCGKQGHQVQNQNVEVRTRAQQARGHVMTHQEAAATNIITATAPPFSGRNTGKNLENSPPFLVLEHLVSLEFSRSSLLLLPCPRAAACGEQSPGFSVPCGFSPLPYPPDLVLLARNSGKMITSISLDFVN